MIELIEFVEEGAEKSQLGGWAFSIAAYWILLMGAFMGLFLYFVHPG